MEFWLVILGIALVIGVIVSNIMALKYLGNIKTENDKKATREIKK